MNGIITHIQRYSIHDGPGIRTIVFFKGCPLSCLWCCNPEAQSFHLELEFISSLCQQCGRCLEVCPENAVNEDLNCNEKKKINRVKCTLCMKCVEACPSGALKTVGEIKSVEEIMEVVRKDAAFYRRSNGGITLSGGEPLSQAEFALQLLNKCHQENIHTAVETCGMVPRTILKNVIPFTNLFLFDIKHVNSQKHREYTGVDNRKILENLTWLCAHHDSVILRLPMIPGLNMDNENVENLARLINELGIREVNLMPFHQLGKDKYSHLGKPYHLQNQVDLRLDERSRNQLVQIQGMLESEKITVTIGG